MGDKFNQYLDTFTGKTLHDFLIQEVDDNWESKDGKVYSFYQTKDDTTLVFTLQVKPESQQKGNGLLTFPQLDVTQPKHSFLAGKKTFTEQDFPIKRKEYMDENLGKIEHDYVFASNVLFSFEIARRVDELEPNYPLTRSEVEEAIEHVMSLQEENAKKVKFKFA